MDAEAWNQTWACRVSSSALEAPRCTGAAATVRVDVTAAAAAATGARVVVAVVVVVVAAGAARAAGRAKARQSKKIQKKNDDRK